MKNILLLVHDDEGQEARFQAALDVARALGAHLSCLDVTPMHVIPSDGYGSDATTLLLQNEQQRETVNRARLRERLATEDVTWDWSDRTGFAEECVEEALTLADLVVVSTHLDECGVPDLRGIAAKLIVRSGTPVLAVPPSASGLRATGSALVAWDGSPQAASALTAAVPLLQRAASVTLFEVEDGSVLSPAEEAAAYLSRHDVHPLVVHADPAGWDASTDILAKADGGAYDYVVMGGFGHSRIGEALFGGVTRTMLAKSPVPLFIAR